MVSFQPDIDRINKDQKISITEVQRCTDALRDNTSPGDDGFIGGLYKCFEELPPPL